MGHVLADLLSRESLPENAIRLQFYAAEQANTFYYARVQWAELRAPEYLPTLLDVEEFPILAYRTVSANVYHRCGYAWRGKWRRDAAYCLAIYKDCPYEHALVILERDFDAALDHLRRFGYSGREMWIAHEREKINYYLVHSHTGPLWNSDLYGINFLDPQ